MPIISVLLPVYNGEKYLAEAIQSILEQTETNFELIILDDASTDNTLEIVKQFHDDRIIIETEDQNKGIIYQLNKGIKLAKGKYIARMDADDISYPHRFATQVAFFQKHPQALVVGSFAQEFGNSDGIRAFPTHPREIDYYLNYYCCILHPTVMFDRQKLSDAGKQYEDFQYAEDYGLWINVSNGKNIFNIPESLIKYRTHNKQTHHLHRSIQYPETMKARAAKLKKTFPLSTEKFRNRFNYIAAVYYQTENFTIEFTAEQQKEMSITLFDKLLYRLFRLRNFWYQKPVVYFVQKYLRNS